MGPRRKQSGKASWRRKHFGGGRASQSIASKHEEVALKKRRGDRKLSRRRGGASYAHFSLLPGPEVCSGGVGGGLPGPVHWQPQLWWHCVNNL